MAKDVIVVVNIDAKPKASEALDILILSTAGAKDIKTYRSLEEVAADFPNSGDTEKTYRKVAALFNQGKTTLAETLIRKVKVGGIAAPTGSDAAAKAKALVEAVETIRETDNDWYILLTDQDGDDAVKALFAHGPRARNPQRPSSEPERKTTANSTSARRATNPSPSQTAAAPSSAPTAQSWTRKRTRPTSAMSAPSIHRA